MPVESPCIGVCELDAHQVCSGCGRTLAEIGEWMQAAPNRQREIVTLAAKRLKQKKETKS